MKTILTAEDVRTPPRCSCHDEPMSRNGFKYYRTQKPRSQKWRCSVTNRGRMEEEYWNLTSLQYNYRLLRFRRVKALRRMRRREELSGTLSS